MKSGAANTLKLAPALVPKLEQCLDALGYGRIDPPPYARLAAQGDGIRVTLYESGKLLLQGKREREVHAELAALGVLPAPAGGIERALGVEGPARSSPRARPSAPARGAARAPAQPDQAADGASATARAPRSAERVPAQPAQGASAAAGASGDRSDMGAADPGAPNGAPARDAPALPHFDFDLATTVIGSDEAGKGDFFGRLVVASCAVDARAQAALAALGLMDSKRLTDHRVRALAIEVRAMCPHEIVSISPARYNELYESFQNVNHLLAWAHAQALEGLLAQTGGAREIVIDQFASNPRVVTSRLGERARAVRLRQRTKAEEEIPVAAASVLARDAFVRTIDDLSRRFDMELPKGTAPHVEKAGRAFVKRYGPEALREVAKLHFRTTSRVLGAPGP